MIRYVIAAAALLAAAPVLAAEVSPSQCPEASAFQSAFNSQNVDGLVSLYTTDAIQADPAGIAVGQDAIKTHLKETLSRDKLTNDLITVQKCYVEASNVKWSAGDWKASSPNGAVGGVWTAITVKDGENYKIRNLTYTAAPLGNK